MIDAPNVRRKRLRLRCWRRGTREMDLILGRFADARLPELDPEMLAALEALLSENDNELYYWVSGREIVPVRHREIVMQIREHHGLA